MTPLALLAPMFLAGAALIGVPWYLHHIRRPERELQRFSSLLFVPQVKKEIIERRRLQHLLLMLLRMLVLALLALVFARPYLRTFAEIPEPNGAGRHLILLDVSYSMGVLDGLSGAKNQALTILDKLGGDDRVGVITFAASPAVAAPLSEPGDHAQARRAIESAALTQETTAYLPALQRAQELLLADHETPEGYSETLVIHLVSDFQVAGMPDGRPASRVSRLITLDAAPVGIEDVANYALVELSLREGNTGQLRVQGKVKNWSQRDERPRKVSLVVNGSEVDTNTVSVKPRNATLTAFSFTAPAGRALEGWLEFEDDAVALDNRRYFTWNVRHKKKALLLADPRPGKRWPASALMARALPESSEAPWTLSRMSQKEFVKGVSSTAPAPDLLLACDLNGLDGETAAAILDYARSGGRVLLALNDTMDAEALNTSLLQALGLETSGLRFPSARETRFDLLYWVDLDHPIFFPFQSARFNDFSQIRFFNYHLLSVEGNDAEVLARLEGDADRGEFPAILEVPFGGGRIILWTFGVDLEWSTFAKSTRFLPVLHETIAYLIGNEPRNRSWLVGDIPAPPDSATDKGDWIVDRPDVAAGATELAAQSDALFTPLKGAGFLRWTHSTQSERNRVDSVNIDPREADPTRIAPEELALKLCAAPIAGVAGVSQDASWERIEAESEQRHEFGLALMGVVFCALLLEGWYASKLT